MLFLVHTRGQDHPSEQDEILRMQDKSYPEYIFLLAQESPLGTKQDSGTLQDNMVLFSVIRGGLHMG